VWAGSINVIASEAKQSISPRKKEWIASSLALLAMTSPKSLGPSMATLQFHRAIDPTC
jgi:hypothetical protein